MNYCGFNIESFCSDVCGDRRRLQTLAEICRNMSICCGFRAVAAREKYPVFVLLGIPFSHSLGPPFVLLFIHSFTTFSGLCVFAYKSLVRNGIRFGMLMYSDDLPSADIDANGPFGFGMVGVGLGEGCHLHQITVVWLLRSLGLWGISYVTGSTFSWWRHQMETFSALLAICMGNSLASGEFPTQRPVKRSFDVFFDLSLNKRLRK